MRRRGREGFVMLSVLWVLVSIASLAMAASLAGRSAHAASRNRASLTIAYWRADDCVERARAAIDLALTSPPLAGDARASENAWQRLDRAIAPSALLAHCDLTLTPIGATWNINALSAGRFRLLLVKRGFAASADWLVDAFLDWCDADDVPRSLGAERVDYEARRTNPPRNGPIASMAELRRVRGFEALDSLDSVLGVEPGLLAIEHASLEAIALVAGIDAEAIQRISELRAANLPLGDLTQLNGMLSAESRAVLQAGAMQRSLELALAPEGWMLTSRGHAGSPSVEVSIETRLQRAGDRIAIVQRREVR